MCDTVPMLRKLYSVMQTKENNLGGGEGCEGMYGSITQAGVSKVLEEMVEHTALGDQSVLVDVGAGLGRPLLHAYIQHGVRGFGIEVDEVKCAKANPFVHQVLDAVEAHFNQPSAFRPVIHCKPIEQVPSLDPATHAYSFWEGVPPIAKQAFGQLFAQSNTLCAVTVVQKATRDDPETMMSKLGFGKLQLVNQYTVNQQGSHSAYKAYVFKRVEALPKVPSSAFNDWWCTEVPAPAQKQQQLSVVRRSSRIFEYGQQRRNSTARGTAGKQSSKPAPTAVPAPGAPGIAGSTAGASMKSGTRKLLPLASLDQAGKENSAAALLQMLPPVHVSSKATLGRSASVATGLELLTSQGVSRPGSRTPSTSPSSPHSHDGDILVRTQLRTDSQPRDTFARRQQCDLQSRSHSRSLTPATSMELAVQKVCIKAKVSPIKSSSLSTRGTPGTNSKVQKSPVKTTTKSAARNPHMAAALAAVDVPGSTVEDPSPPISSCAKALTGVALVREQGQKLTNMARTRRTSTRYAAAKGRKPDVPSTVPELGSPPSALVCSGR